MCGERGEVTIFISNMRIIPTIVLIDNIDPAEEQSPKLSSSSSSCFNKTSDSDLDLLSLTLGDIGRASNLRPAELLITTAGMSTFNLCIFRSF